MSCSVPAAAAGYDVVAVEPVKQGLLCQHCKKVLRNAVQTEEGYRLCEICCKEISSAPSRKCLNCGIEINPKENIFPDRAVRREVLDLHVKCAYHTLGCPWEGLLKYWEKHCESCRWRAVECPNNGCDVCLPAMDLDSHIDACPFRNIACDCCHQEIPANQLELHYEHCPEFLVTCSKCEKKVARSQMEKHNLYDCAIEECFLCDQQVFRKTTTERRNQEEGDLHLAEPKAVFEHTQLLALQHKMTQKLLAECKLQQQEDIAEGRQMILETRSSCSDLKELFGRLSLRLTAMETQLQTWSLEKGSKADKNVVSQVQELLATVGAQEKAIQQQNRQHGVLKQQLETLKADCNRNTQTITQLRYQGSSYDTSSTKYYGETMSESRVMQLERKIEEIERQTAMMKVHVSELELQLQASLASTHNGAFLWRIPEVSRRKRDAIEERITSIYSPPFYTGRNGYKMCIRAYLNGDGIGYETHLSIFFVLMKGEFDPLLKWPFDCKVSLILVDLSHRKHIVQTFKPTPESSSFQRPRSDMNVASGCPQFAKLSVLDDENYVKEDVLYLKCIVDTSRIFHP